MNGKQTNEEVMTQSDKQLINELIESSVKTALENLNLSANECPIDGQSDQPLDNICETTSAEDIANSCQTTDETKSEPNFSTIQYSEVNTTSNGSNTSVNKKIKTKSSNESTLEDMKRIQSTDNKAIDESEDKLMDKEVDTGVDRGVSCDQSCEVSQIETNYVNTVLNDTFGKPVVNRYPLRHRWQLWFWRADPGLKVVWHSALQRVCKPFETIEQFWRLYHHIVCVQHLIPPSDYCVFKEGIEPTWEDRLNINGGKWSLEFSKGPNREPNPHLDEIWLEVLLCLIGEGFNEFGEEICGAVVNIRSKEDRISVWTANANKSVANLKIGEILKMRTGYEGQLKYEAHSTSQRIAEEKDRLFDNKLHIRAKPKSKPIRRSCVF